MSQKMPERAQPILALGLGCRRGCPAATLLAAVEEVLRAHDLSVLNVHAIASIELKRDESGLLELARQLDVPLYFFSASQLRSHEAQLSHRSEASFEHTACHGVAESSALALASQSGRARLLVTRQKSPQVTIALAITCPNGR
jgi:cobalt-precorrin 5A hydrolase